MLGASAVNQSKKIKNKKLPFCDTSMARMIEEMACISNKILACKILFETTTAIKYLKHSIDS